MAVYDRQTAPIMPYYAAQGILRVVDGMAEIDEVTRQIEAALGTAVTSKGLCQGEKGRDSLV
jgi:adenylate kinase